MLPLEPECLDLLRERVADCLDNLDHPACTLEHAGRFYEEAAEALRAHAIASLLLRADVDAFSRSLVSSCHARRAYLRRCARHGHADHFLALSRSGALFDALAAGDPALAAEIFSLSPTGHRQGDEYLDDFRWQRFVGLQLGGATAAELEEAVSLLDAAAEGAGARLDVARALRARDPDAFEAAFQGLLAEREAENLEDADRADEELVAAAGAKVFVEGLAVLHLARAAGIPVAGEYPMCPALALLPRKAATPPDEFAAP